MSKRIGWIDLVRALGACAIVLLHVTVSTYQTTDIDAMRKGVYILSGIVFGRWAVPAFFMVTGYLVLDPSRPFGWRRARSHAWRMALVLLTLGMAFSLVEETLYYVDEGMPLGLGVVADAAIDVLTARSWDHLWYVYALMFVYLLIPLVERLRSRFGARAVHALALVLFVGTMVVPTVLDLGAIAGLLSWPGQYGGWRSDVPWGVVVGLTNVLIGDWLRDKRMSALSLVLGAAALATMLAVSAWGLVEGWGSQSFVYMHESCFASVYGASVLLVIRRVRGDEPLAAGSLANALAQDSFGIYLLHPAFIHMVLRYVDALLWPPVLFEATFFVAVLAASVLATRLLRHVPVVGPLL